MDGNLHTPRKLRLPAMFQRAGWFFAGMGVLAVCMLFRWYAPLDSLEAKAPPSEVKKASATEPSTRPAGPPTANSVIAPPKKNPIAAIVNNEPITRDELAHECLVHFGSEVLESMVNRTLILAACQQRQIAITEKQVDDEVDRMARKFGLGKDQWLSMLEKERGIKASRYAKDVIWPTLALRELAKGQLTVSQKELDEAYDGEFGPSVKVRLIAIEDADKARQVHAQAVAKPEEFPALAKKHSKDINSASAYGLIQPIRRHAGDPQLEAAAFALKKGEISKIVKVGEMFVFVKCEEQLPPAKGVDRAQVDPMLRDALRDRKLRAAASGVFKDLQNQAKVENILNDPLKSKQMPGVAATVNGQKITMRELAEECADRHGRDVLDGTINRKLLDQALRRRSLKVTDTDLDTEIGRAALAMGQALPDGKPDVEAWIERVTKAENISRDVYVRDEVWPSAALKRIVGDGVKVTQEDLKRGYDANYGPQVQCRAIVLNNERRAREVWEMARENPTVKNFGDLAEQYSIEAGSRSLRGEVPPIQRNGGQPLLEQEAFSLKPGELSGVIQAGSTYVILYCEGYTKPIKTSFDEVKELLFRDIHEKKLRLAMGRAFDQMKEDARVDNFLTNNMKVPKNEQPAGGADPSVKIPKVMSRR
jgi:parvulin-like peptidyl-prolyl isomerase